MIVDAKTVGAGSVADSGNAIRADRAVEKMDASFIIQYRRRIECAAGFPFAIGRRRHDRIVAMSVYLSSRSKSFQLAFS